MSTWDMSRNEGRVGTGNWEAWGKDVDIIVDAAKVWKEALGGVDKPWLCWHLDDDWCKLQQKLVLSIGWTPIVGNDNSSSHVTILDGAIAMDFNSQLKLPSMWMHFPLEFVFLFIDKMAFWHSDLICSMADMHRYGKLFEGLQNGEMAAVKHLSGWKGFRNPFINHFGELIGCTTKAASESQFNNGCGWWRHIECHPNMHKHNIEKVYYEHGTGIYVWKKKFKGIVKTLDVNEEDGHATVYRKNMPRSDSKAEEMRLNFDLHAMCKKLGIDSFLDS